VSMAKWHFRLTSGLRYLAGGFFLFGDPIFRQLKSRLKPAELAG
jgi:hypothetical protein